MLRIFGDLDPYTLFATAVLTMRRCVCRQGRSSIDPSAWQRLFADSTYFLIMEKCWNNLKQIQQLAASLRVEGIEQTWRPVELLLLASYRHRAAASPIAVDNMAHVKQLGRLSLDYWVSSVKKSISILIISIIDDWQVVPVQLVIICIQFITVLSLLKMINQSLILI